jgi:hypothetical protein
MLSAVGMRSKTHERITRAMFPSVDPLVIDAVNSILDDPPPWLSDLPQMGRLPLLSYAGHRARGGHDILTALIGSLLTGGYHGLAVAAVHLSLDTLRDLIVRRFGVHGADLAEDVLNILYEVLDEGNEKPKKRSRTKSRTASSRPVH